MWFTCKELVAWCIKGIKRAVFGERNGSFANSMYRSITSIIKVTLNIIFMKRTRNYSWLICFMLLFSLGSCIKEEALNMEADIVGVHADEDVFLLNPVISNT